MDTPDTVQLRLLTTKNITLSSNGRTSAFGADNQGSNPCSVSIVYVYILIVNTTNNYKYTNEKGNTMMLRNYTVKMLNILFAIPMHLTILSRHSLFSTPSLLGQNLIKNIS